MGFLFSNSSFHEPRWSERLGYGMAVIGEDTRVHLHQNGKYIIRRALDREHAEMSYRLISGLLRPALMDDRSGKPLWYLLREYTIDREGSPEHLAQLVGWPDMDILPISSFEEVIEGIHTIDDVLISVLRTSDSVGGPGHDREGTDGILERIKGEMANAHGMSFSSPLYSLGRLSGLIWCYKALQEIKLLQEESSMDGPGTDMARSRIKFLLHDLES
jgi:hypothetical protein